MAGCSSSSDAPAARPDSAGSAGAPAEVVVYKTETCGCCNDWIEHMREAGFQVRGENRQDMDAIKAQYGIRPAMSSCHTAVVDGYVIEGHVPADLVQRLLRERPPVLGLTAPGMPVGSPGMEVPSGAKEPFTVFALGRDGRAEVYARR